MLKIWSRIDSVAATLSHLHLASLGSSDTDYGSVPYNLIRIQYRYFKNLVTDSDSTFFYTVRIQINCMDPEISETGLHRWAGAQRSTARPTPACRRRDRTACCTTCHNSTRHGQNWLGILQCSGSGWIQVVSPIRIRTLKTRIHPFFALIY